MLPTTNQLLSYLFTFGIYACTFNWRMALVLMIGVGFHECGHLWAARKMGLKTGGFFLWPFVGGAALIQSRYARYSQQSFTVLMGPMWGAFLSFVCYGLYLLTDWSTLGEAAEWMALINLFNLAPLSQLDGGQIMETITFSINETLGVTLMAISTVAGVILIWPLNPIISGIIVLYGGPYLWSTYNNWNMRRQGKGFLVTALARPMKKSQIFQTVGAYLGTAGALITLYTMIKSGGEINYSNLFH